MQRKYIYQQEGKSYENHRFAGCKKYSFGCICQRARAKRLDQIVDLMVKSEKINDKEAYRKQVYAREEESTTGIGEGIAIPHGKCDAVTKPGLAAMVVKDGVDFDSLDGEPVIFQCS